MILAGDVDVGDVIVLPAANESVLVTRVRFARGGLVFTVTPADGDSAGRRTSRNHDHRSPDPQTRPRPSPLNHCPPRLTVARGLAALACAHAAEPPALALHVAGRRPDLLSSLPSTDLYLTCRTKHSYPISVMSPRRLS